MRESISFSYINCYQNRPPYMKVIICVKSIWYNEMCAFIIGSVSLHSVYGRSACIIVIHWILITGYKSASQKQSPIMSFHVLQEKRPRPYDLFPNFAFITASPKIPGCYLFTFGFKIVRFTSPKVQCLCFLNLDVRQGGCFRDEAEPPSHCC